MSQFAEENAALDQEKRHVVLVSDSLTEGWERGDRIRRFLHPLRSDELHALQRDLECRSEGDPAGIGRLYFHDGILVSFEERLQPGSPARDRGLPGLELHRRGA